MRKRRITTIALCTIVCAAIAGAVGCAPSKDKDEPAQEPEAAVVEEREQEAIEADEADTQEAVESEAVETEESGETDAQELVAEKPEEDTQVDPAYHVTASGFEFDIPEYWRDRVEWRTNEPGTVVTIYPITSMSAPDNYYLARIELHPSSDPLNAGDYVSHRAGIVEGSDERVEVWTNNWPAYYADYWASNPNYGGSSQELEMVDAFLDLSTGGAITRSEVMDAAANSSGPGNASKDLGAMDIDFVEENLSPSIAFTEGSTGDYA